MKQPNPPYILTCPTDPAAEPVTYALPSRGEEPCFELAFDFIALDEGLQGEICLGDWLCILDWGHTKRLSIALKNGALGFPGGGEVPYTVGKPARVRLVMRADATGGRYDAYVDNQPAATDAPMKCPAAASRFADFAHRIGGLGVKSLAGRFELRHFSRPVQGMCNTDHGLPRPQLCDQPGVSRTFYVGPGRYYQKPQDCIQLMRSGDIMLVDGDATYPAPLVFPQHTHHLTVRGVPVNGKRPLLHSDNTNNYVTLRGDHQTLDNFELCGNMQQLLDEYNAAGVQLTRQDFAHPNPQQQAAIARMAGRTAMRGGYFFNNHNQIVRCRIHDFKMGIISPDTECGSMRIAHCEVFNCGLAGGEHNIYVATDGARYPDATLRVEYCYIHDALVGNGLKTRCGRDEVYHNVFYHNAAQSLELIGAAPGTDIEDGMAIFGIAQQWRQVDPQFDLFTVRADSDVVGNYIEHAAGALVRCGGDGCGDISEFTGSHHATYGKTFGRYRFVNNTFVHTGAGEQYAIRLEFAVESLEAYNNVFVARDRMRVVNVAEEGNVTCVWAAGFRQIAGSHNWVQNTCTHVPAEWACTMTGPDPRLADRKPAADSPLRDCGLPIGQTRAVWPPWQNTLYTYPQGLPAAFPLATYGPGQPRVQTNRDTAFPRPRLTLENAIDPQTCTNTGRTDGTRPTLGCYQS